VFIVGLLVFVLGRSSFVVDASGGTEYTVEVSRSVLREYVDDIGLFARNMPGVVGIESLGDDVFLYHTRKEIPLSGAMETTFRIRKIVESDSVTRYQSVDPDDDNYMSCTVRVRPRGEDRTAIAIALTIRLARENPSEVHWLAPVFGADFISERMNEDIEGMLEAFVQNSTTELQGKYMAETREADGAR